MTTITARAEEVRRCKHTSAFITGRPACSRRTVYQVSRPSDKDDVRDTCRIHLAATVDALSQGDASLMLTVIYVPAVTG
jgi:hypothetical protein